MDKERIDRIIDKHHGEASSLIQVLLDIQSENSWLPREALERVAERLQVPMTRIQHIATFYKAFSLVPKGRHQIHICMGTACHVRGSPRLLTQLEYKLQIQPGQTTGDLQFSLEEVNCVGACALGPLVIVDGVYQGHMTAARLSKLVDHVRVKKGESQ